MAFQCIPPPPIFPCIKKIPPRGIFVKRVTCSYSRPFCYISPYDGLFMLFWRFIRHIIAIFRQNFFFKIITEKSLSQFF